MGNSGQGIAIIRVSFFVVARSKYHAPAMPVIKIIINNFGCLLEISVSYYVSIKKKRHSVNNGSSVPAILGKLRLLG